MNTYSSSPYDSYKPYPVQEKVDPSDPLYLEYEREQDARRQAATAAPEADTSTYDLKKATQYGSLERVQELLEQGADVNELDSDGVSPLHWAAINNRKEIASIYIGNGAVIDKYGGTLNSTPLHWATRQGHLPMMVQLIKAGADPTAVDGEGYQCIHLATMFGHSKIVAYLAAKGFDVDTPDNNGMTPLMWACYRTSNYDPTRLLLSLGADVNKKDLVQGNTPLHWGLQVSNHTALTLICKQNVDLNALNLTGQSPLDVAKTKKNRWLIEKLARQRLEKGFDNPGWLKRKTMHNSEFRKYYMMAYPFFVLWAIGWTFEADYWWCYWWMRLCLLGFVYLSWQYSKRYIFDDNLGITIPFGIYLATKTWMYFTWFFYILPHINSGLIHLAFFANTALLMYHFYMAVKCDPGFIQTNRQQQSKVILDLAELETISVEQFCSTCIIHKPLRSKHCSTCNKCVAKFDHHCPWIFNCVGASNTRHFILYLTYLIGMILWCSYGCVTFWRNGCATDEDKWVKIAVDRIRCSPWVTWIFLNCCIHLLFVGVLLGNMLYQTVYLGLTTNERINLYRYKHFSKTLHFTILTAEAFCKIVWMLWRWSVEVCADQSRQIGETYTACLESKKPCSRAPE
ncbi:ZDHHC17 [Bugula neritina]|uniref:Palmitoyltransferase n=1 Tax=Bugula neritina TaxID=10212 RepID=A0A7J7IWV2_BUGNE|nr:ZDHHC17 [Bugula neritina]